MYMNSNYLNTLFVLTLTCLLSACGSETESTIETPMSEVELGIQVAVTNVVIDASSDFSQSITTLNTNIDTFCNAVDATNLSNLQSAWSDSFASWYKIMPFQFGPLLLTDDNAAISNYIDFYRNSTSSSRASNLADINSGLTTLIAGASITETSLSSALTKNVGLLVLETAIFSDLSGSEVPVDIVTEFTTTPKKCDTLQALGYELNDRATYIQSQWTTNYRDTGISYLSLFTNNELENYFSSFDIFGDGLGTPSSETLIISVQEFFDFIAGGEASKSADIFNDLTRYSSQPLWNALEASILTIENLLDQSSETELSLFAIMKNNGYEQDVETIQANIVTIKTAISDQHTVDFIAAAQALDGNFKTSVINGLNINKGLSFADGDG